MSSIPPPSEPDVRISRIRLSSRWFTSKRVDVPFRGVGQDPTPANVTENFRDWFPVARMTKAVNMHLTCAASSGHGFQPVALSDSHSPWALASVCLLSVTHPCIHLPALLCSRPITALPRSYERSDSCPPGSSALPSMNSGSCYEQVSLIHALDLPIPPSPTTSQSPNVAFARYPSARRVSRFCGSRFCLTPAGSPIQTGRIEFVILRMDRSPPAAPHPASRRRSCIRFQAGERMPGEDFHLSDHVRFKAHLRRVMQTRRK